MPDRIAPLQKKVQELENKIKDIILEIELSKEDDNFRAKYSGIVRNIAEDVVKRLYTSPKTRSAPRKRTTTSRSRTKKTVEEKEGSDE